MSTGYCVGTDDMILCAIGVLIENVLDCAVAEILLVHGSCDYHNTILFNERELTKSCWFTGLMFVELAWFELAWFELVWFFWIWISEFWCPTFQLQKYSRAHNFWKGCRVQVFTYLCTMSQRATVGKIRHTCEEVKYVKYPPTVTLW